MLGTGTNEDEKTKTMFTMKKCQSESLKDRFSLIQNFEQKSFMEGLLFWVVLKLIRLITSFLLCYCKRLTTVTFLFAFGNYILNGGIVKLCVLL